LEVKRTRREANHPPSAEVLPLLPYAFITRIEII